MTAAFSSAPSSVQALLARDIMIPEPICVEPSTTLRALAKILEENEISGAPVVNHAGHVVGVVSKTDLIRRCSSGADRLPPAYVFEAIDTRAARDPDVIPESLLCVDDLMTRDPVTVPATMPASEVARLMYQRRIHRVIVVDAQQFPLGIITSLDVLGRCCG
jgi:CBS domain-containing protein